MYFQAHVTIGMWRTRARIREPLPVLTVRILGWARGARQGQMKVRSEPNPTEFFICSTYLSGTPRSSCLFSPALLSMMNLRWPRKLRNSVGTGERRCAGGGQTSEGEGQVNSANEQLETKRQGDRVGNKERWGMGEGGQGDATIALSLCIVRCC